MYVFFFFTSQIIHVFGFIRTDVLKFPSLEPAMNRKLRYETKYMNISGVCEINNYISKSMNDI